ncbi:hypothetical protein [Chloroflexus aurantiacus]|nr:hypothetical protein [Chloroflexus aurantiacus]
MRSTRPRLMVACIGKSNGTAAHPYLAWHGMGSTAINHLPFGWGRAARLTGDRRHQALFAGPARNPAQITDLRSQRVTQVLAGGARAWHRCTAMRSTRPRPMVACIGKSDGTAAHPYVARNRMGSTARLVQGNGTTWGRAARLTGDRRHQAVFAGPAQNPAQISDLRSQRVTQVLVVGARAWHRCMAMRSIRPRLIGGLHRQE